MTKFKIVDSFDNHCFKSKSFNSYEDGWDFLYQKYPVIKNADGKIIEAKREVIIQDYNLEYFQKTHVSGKWSLGTPEQRLARWKKNYPNGKKLLKETRTIEKGGWWYVKEAKNTDSTIKFSREHDKFFAPTLEEAVKLYLDSIN